MSKHIAVIYGGKSSEHDISCISAANIMKKLDREKYEVHAIGITKEGSWRYLGPVPDPELVDEIANDEAIEACEARVAVSMDRESRGFIVRQDAATRLVNVDVWFPVLHGKNGEDGTIQGLFEMSGIPYVGCGVLASSGGMDKVSTKLFADKVGVTQARFIADVMKDGSTIHETIERVEKELGYPVFVKPSNAGSSKGVTKAHNREELVEAIRVAKENDHRILIEEFIDGREVECAVLGGERPEASCVGEIKSAAEFYDFDAKYNNAESKTVVDPDDLPEEAKEAVREDAVKVFKTLDGFGLARVDFFVRRSDNQVIFNEINTMPGFTGISMYPMLWEAMGVDVTELLTRLIEMAEDRWKPGVTEV
ncbi:MAG: D-alanine--D-alanine ligase [Eubacterium sp.]|nr:D-alanine--D-alanine ligase [Eubacterium sp.]